MGAEWSQDGTSRPPPNQQVQSSNTSSDMEVNNTDGEEVEKTVEGKLPYRYEDIVKDADSQIDKSSVKKLYDQLHHGVFLNKKKEKYWVDKESGSNSFMLFARSLSITWGDDQRYWMWTNLKETSDVSVDVAELLNVCWLEIHAKFETTKLSPRTLYEVAFVIMLKQAADGWDVPVNLRLLLPNGTKIEHKENLKMKPREQWIEIPVGEFRNSPEKAGEMEISMYEYQGGRWKKGLVIKGVLIRPIN